MAHIVLLATVVGLWIQSALTKGHQVGQQTPFVPCPSNPDSPSTKLSINNSFNSSRPLKVAIIGGGPAGTSASFFLSKIANSSGRSIETVLYERSKYLGGRSNVVYPFDDSKKFEPVEIGGSMFVQANKHLLKACELFNLSVQSFMSDDDSGTFAIWDGTEFDYEETGNSWLDNMKLIWRYGRAPFQLNSLVKKAVVGFESVYQPEYIAKGPFEQLYNWGEEIGLSHLLTVTASKNLIEENNISPQAVNELAAVAVRVNYGQDISEIHALGAAISLAGKDGMSVKGGNKQIFENFARSSGSKILLGHQVTAITELKRTAGETRPQYVLMYQESDPHPSSTTKAHKSGRSSRSKASEPFDAIVLASPYHLSQIKFANIPDLSIPGPTPYVHLYVTIVVTNSSAPSGEIFNRPLNDPSMPKTIASTMMRNVLGKGKRPIFNSLSYLKNIGGKDGVQGDMHVVKIFSESPMCNETLGKIFKSSNNLIWIRRVEWDAYPYLKPLPTKSSFPPTKLASGIYYVNAFESIVSTMETQTVASWNIAGLLSKDFWNYQPTDVWFD